MSPFRDMRAYWGERRERFRACVYSVSDQRVYDAVGRSAEVICCLGGTLHQCAAEYLGEDTNDLHGVPMQINKNSTAGLAH